LFEIVFLIHRPSVILQQKLPNQRLIAFPFDIESATDFAREKFEYFWSVNPGEINSYLMNRDIFSENPVDESHIRNLLMIKTAFVDEVPPANLEMCVHWARKKFQDLFYNYVLNVLHVHPIDSEVRLYSIFILSLFLLQFVFVFYQNHRGGKFWSGCKLQAPNPIEFNPKDMIHMGFIVSASNLRAHMYGIKERIDPFTCLSALADYVVPPFVPRVQYNSDFGRLFDRWDTQIPAQEFADINQLRDFLVSTLPSKSSF
jgi:ubiquitin-activating enzyme E1